MTNFILCERGSLVVVAAGAPEYSLSEAAALAGVHPDLVSHYCRLGLLGEEKAQRVVEPVFDEQGIYDLRRIEDFRRRHGINLGSLPVVCSLLREIERLETEIGQLRSKP
jgi:DNA-binding transcriptional MerR regulator